MRIIIEIDAEENRGARTTGPLATVTTGGRNEAMRPAAVPESETGGGEIETLSAGPAPSLPGQEEEVTPQEGMAAETAAATGLAPEPGLPPREEAALRADETAGGLSAGAAPEIVE